MTWRHFQQFIYAVACGVIFITCQLQANASDFYRDRIISGQFGSTLKVLVGTSFVTALLSSFCRQQVIHYRLFCMIGVFRHQLFNLHQTRHAGFDIVIIRLDQYVALVTGNHWTDNDPGDQ